MRLQHRDFAGTLAAIYQPGEEEGFAGAKHMIADGLAVERFLVIR